MSGTQQGSAIGTGSRGANLAGHHGSVISTFLFNLGWGGVRGILFAINTLVLIPLLILRLGKDQFAILALLTPFLRFGLYGVFDFGIAAACVRFMSRDFALGQKTAINEYVSSALFLYLAFDGILLTIFYLFSGQLLSFFLRSNPLMHNQAAPVFKEAVWIYAVFLLSNPFFALLMGIQKVHLTHVVGALSLLVELLGILILVPFGLTLRRVMWVYAFNAFAGLAFTVLLGRHFFLALRIRWRSVSWRRVADLLRYGSRFAVTKSTSLLNPILDKLILAGFVGLSAVTWYEAAARLVQVLTRATQLLLLPVFPLAGAADQTYSVVQKKDFYARLFSLNLLLSALLYILPTTLTFVIFRVWIGQESRAACVAFIFLASTAFCQALSGPLTLILAGTGRLSWLIASGLAGLMLNVTLTPILARTWGLVGLLAGTFIAYGLVTLGLIGFAGRCQEFSLASIKWAPAVVFPLIAAFGPAALMLHIWGQGKEATSFGGLVVLASAAVTSFTGLLLLRAENREALRQIFAHLKGMGRAARPPVGDDTNA